MSAATFVSLESYLATTYRPDQEWIEGYLVERNLGEYDHSNLQGALLFWLRSRQGEWNIRVLPEQRLRVSACRYRSASCRTIATIIRTFQLNRNLLPVI